MFEYLGIAHLTLLYSGAPRLRYRQGVDAECNFFFLYDNCVVRKDRIVLKCQAIKPLALCVRTLPTDQLSWGGNNILCLLASNGREYRCRHPHSWTPLEGPIDHPRYYQKIETEPVVTL